METDEKTEIIDLTDATQGGLFGIDFAPSAKRKAPSSSRAAVAERVRRHMAQKADIGELPAVADPERRARCEASLVAFVREYCMGILLDHEPSPRLEAYAKRLQDSIEGAGFTHVRFPRGGGKTAWIKGALAWGASTGRLRFPIVYGASASLATAILDDIWRVFTSSDPFAADFPAVSFPIRAGGGSAQRWLSQTYHGADVGVVKNTKEARLPTIEGAASSGAIIRAFGAMGASRGTAFGALRPDFLLFDDLQTRKVAESQQLVEKMSKWIQGDALGVGGGTRSISAVMTSTPICYGDLSEVYADKDRHGEWLTVEWPLVVSWPKRSDLWDEYLEIRRECVQSGDTTFAAATAFYDAHRAEMDEGADVLDPLAFDARLERSAIQRAYNLIATMGREAFDAEYQLVTKDARVGAALTPSLVRSRVNGCPRLTAPTWADRAVFGFVDVNDDPGISWGVCSFGRRRTAAVVDYGRWSEGRDRLCEQNDSPTKKTIVLSRAIRHVLEYLLKIRVIRQSDGEALPVERILVDVSDQPETVFGAIRDATRAAVKSGRIANEKLKTIMGCRGRGNIDFLKLTRGEEVKKWARTQNVDVRTSNGHEWICQNVDVWREIVQGSFFEEPSMPGSLSLFGKDRNAHHDFSLEITAQYLFEKLQSKDGTRYVWRKKPGIQGRNDHWLDCLIGCYSCASWDRAYASDVAIARSATMPTAATPRAVRRARSAGLRRVAATIAL